RVPHEVRTRVTGMDGTRASREDEHQRLTPIEPGERAPVEELTPQQEAVLADVLAKAERQIRFPGLDSADKDDLVQITSFKMLRLMRQRPNLWTNEVERDRVHFTVI